MRIAKRLDDDVMVLKFIKDPFPIQYFEEQSREYFPDFLVFTVAGVYLIEVKPDEMLPYVENKTKAAINSGFNFVVLNLKDKFPWN
jgi:DNA-directed RNA polymerase specialized sigma54-like protein